ncbi:MAG: M56 family metallopeptidase [Candidatus Dormibacteria bacterium]
MGIAALQLVGWIGFAVKEFAATSVAFRRLPQGVPSAEVSRAGRAVCARHIAYIATPTPIAFCVGLLRPRIVISEGAVATLSPSGLEAVLAHEAHHQRHLEPMRRALRAAAARVWFYLPLLTWWVSSREEVSELAADRHAIESVGPAALAHALLAFDTPVGSIGTAAFAGSLAPRVAQLLGDPHPVRRPDRGVLGGTAVGLVGSLVLANCVAQLTGHIFAAV